MTDVATVRRENLKALSRKHGGHTALAKRLGYTGPSYVTQLVRGQAPFTEKSARAIERKMGLPEFALDQRPGEKIPFEGTDRSLLAASIRAIASALDDSRAKLAPQKFAELTALVYERAVERGSVDLDHVRHLISLAV